MAPAKYVERVLDVRIFAAAKSRVGVSFNLRYRRCLIGSEVMGNIQLRGHPLQPMDRSTSLPLREQQQQQQHSRRSPGANALPFRNLTGSFSSSLFFSDFFSSSFSFTSCFSSVFQSSSDFSTVRSGDDILARFGLGVMDELVTLAGTAGGGVCALSATFYS